MTQDLRHLDEELAELNKRLLVMGGLAEERVHMAARGLIEGDVDLVAQVTDGDEAINTLQIEIDDRCFKLLALNQPMAVDLRFIVSAVKINSDLERVGDLAVNIAEVSQRYIRHPLSAIPAELSRMGDLAQRMLHDALDAFVRRDAALAQAVILEDSELDTIKTWVFRHLLDRMLGSPATIEAAIDLILVSRHLERIGDHATNIAEDVIFIIAAQDVRHRSVNRGA